jgi:hypothetical protein
MDVEGAKPEPGVGCRPLATILGLLLGLAGGAGLIGLALIGDTGCLGTCERVGFALYGTGLPVSAAFSAAAGGDLVVAYLTDIIVWVAASVGMARLVERRVLLPSRAVALVMAAAVVYGLVISGLIERA